MGTNLQKEKEKNYFMSFLNKSFVVVDVHEMIVGGYCGGGGGCCISEYLFSW